MVCILGLRKHFPPASAGRKRFLHATIQKSCGVARAHTACDTHHTLVGKYIQLKTAGTFFISILGAWNSMGSLGFTYLSTRL